MNKNILWKNGRRENRKIQRCSSYGIENERLGDKPIENTRVG